MRLRMRSNVDLIVKNQKGSIEIQLDAKQTRFRKFELFHQSYCQFVGQCDVSDGTPKISISTYGEGKMIYLKIKDQGLEWMSIPKHIFESFREQSGNIHNVKGHGLGLSYVKKIVELHGGNIKLISKIGEGTTFVISVPLL